MAKYEFNALEARKYNAATEFVAKAKFAYEHGENGKRTGLSLSEFAHNVAAREAADQLGTLLIYRKALNGVAEQVPMVGRMYPVDIVRWIFEAADYNYFGQFMRLGLISEPQGGLVTIDWPKVVEMLQTVTTAQDIVWKLI